MKTFSQAFLSKYPTNGKILTYMAESFGVTPDWNNLTKLNLIDFVDYLDERVSPLSMRSYAAKIKTVIGIYSDEVAIPCKDYKKVLSLKNVQSTNTWLTEDELNKLIQYTPNTETERIIRNQAVISAYSGVRHSDCLNLTAENIVNGMLTYVSIKTHHQATVPLKPIVADYLNQQMKIYSDTTYNDTIRAICQNVGITERVKLFKAGQEVVGEKYLYISSHTFRRSFATNLYLRGCDLYSLSKMLGHSNIEMTEKYICCGLKQQSEVVLEYFE